MNVYFVKLLIYEDFFCYILIKSKIKNIKKIKRLIKKDFKTAFDGNENEFIKNFENNLKKNKDFKNICIVYDDIIYMNYNPVKEKEKDDK